MKIKQQSLLIGLVAMLTLSSCLELKEKAHFNNDGSGTFSFVVSLGPIRSLLDMISDFSGETKEEIVEEVDDSFATSAKDLDKIQGISNLQQIKDNKKYEYGLSFDFKNVQALNQAMNKIFEDDSKPKNATFFEMNRSSFKRVDPLNIKTRIEKETEGIDIEIPGLNISAFMSELKYSTEYSFEKKINKVSNNQSVLSLDKKKVSVDYFFMAKDAQGKNIENQIEF